MKVIIETDKELNIIIKKKPNWLVLIMTGLWLIHWVVIITIIFYGIITDPEKFDEEELGFLKTIGKNEPVTISKLYRTSSLPLKRVDQLLVLFICWGLVEYSLSNEGVLYSLGVEK